MGLGVVLKRTWCLLAVLLFAGFSLADQETPEANEPATERPTIGIALGGGGARGLAHVGVLERLDELHIPVDRVAGTSMGAVLGALFSLGYTPREIKQRVFDIDWRQMMTDRPDRNQLSFRRKADDRDNFWPFEFGVTGEGLAFQQSLLAGQNLNFIFPTAGHYTAGYSGFDSLPIPFRAVATNLVTGEEVVLEKGNLLKAVRASMAAPGAFPPVRINDQLLVDGYLRNNVPVDVARDMGADIVIAVHTGWAPGETPEIGQWDLPDIMLQGSYILTYANVEPQLEAADLAITVWQPGAPLYDLTQAEIAIEAGRAAVDQHLEELLPWALPEDEYLRWRQGVWRWDPNPPIIAEVRLDNQTMVSDKTIARRITQAQNDTLDFEKLIRDLGGIYELGVFESVEFSLPENEGNIDLVVHPIAKPYLPWILRFGGSYRMNYQDRARIQLQARLLRFEINGLGAELRNDVVLGSVNGIRSEFYQPLEHSRALFLAPGFFYESRSESVFNESFHLGDYRTNSWGGNLDIGFNIGRFAQTRIGYRIGQTNADTKSGDLDYPKQDDNVGALKFGIGFDRLDHFSTPRRGIAFRAQGWLSQPGLGDSNDFRRYWGDIAGATSSGDWVFLFRAEAGTSRGEMPYYHQFLMGGLRNLTGITDGSLRGDAFAMAGAGVLKHFSGLNLPYATQWYLGFWCDGGNTWDDPQFARFDDTYLGAALTVLLDTSLGPIEGGYGFNSIGWGTFYLQAGIPFAQPFNP
jgi:NTE family protein